MYKFIDRYPTTTTSSEGFAGYMHDPDFGAILMHSRAKTDYRLLQNMPHHSHEENELRQAVLEALESWPISQTEEGIKALSG
jgi:hypothetical protein